MVRSKAVITFYTTGNVPTWVQSDQLVGVIPSSTDKTATVLLVNGDKVSANDPDGTLAQTLLNLVTGDNNFKLGIPHGGSKGEGRQSEIDGSVPTIPKYLLQSEAKILTSKGRISGYQIAEYSTWEALDSMAQSLRQRNRWLVTFQKSDDGSYKSFPYPKDNDDNTES